MIPSGSSNNPARTLNSRAGVSSTMTCCAANVSACSTPASAWNRSQSVGLCVKTAINRLRSHSASPPRLMKTTPSPIAPTFVSPADVDAGVTGGAVDVDVDVLVLVLVAVGGTTAGAVGVIEDEDGDEIPGASAFFAPCPSGITSLGDVGQ